LPVNKSEVSKMIYDSIRRYETKTGEQFLVPDGFAIKIIDDEFMVWKLSHKDNVSYFEINQTFGKMKTFAPFIEEVCRAANINILVAATQRNPKVYARKWKCVELPAYAYEFEGRKYRLVKGNLKDFLDREVKHVST